MHDDRFLDAAGAGRVEVEERGGGAERDAEAHRPVEGKPPSLRDERWGHHRSQGDLMVGLSGGTRTCLVAEKVTEGAVDLF